MVRLALIRHGKTLGNTEGRYIGTTDEPLCPEGILHLEESIRRGIYPRADRVIVSPLLRCRQTAALIYPNQEITLVSDFRETDFGSFENRNYEELKNHPDYQAFLDSGGVLPFPGGEGKDGVSARVCGTFEALAKSFPDWDGQTIALIVHGGTIMTLMERYAVPRREFYAWQVKNGQGFIAEYDGSAEKPVLDKIQALTP